MVFSFLISLLSVFMIFPRITTCPISPIISSIFIAASSKSFPYTTSGLSERFTALLKSPLSDSLLDRKLFRLPPSLWLSIPLPLSDCARSPCAFDVCVLFSPLVCIPVSGLAFPAASWLCAPAACSGGIPSSVIPAARALISATCLAIFSSSSSLCFSPFPSLYATSTFTGRPHLSL